MSVLEEVEQFKKQQEEVTAGNQSVAETNIRENADLKATEGAMVAVTNNELTTESVIKDKKQELLKSNEFQKLAAQGAQAEASSELGQKAAEIKERNVQTAEKEFDVETRKRRLERLQSQLDLQHKYEMGIIKADGEHKAMLDARKKIEEKYGYLYDKDKDGGLVKFSYSKVVNRIREFVRNVDRLDTGIKKLLKWAIIIGVAIVAITLLKRYGILA